MLVLYSVSPKVKVALLAVRAGEGHGILFAVGAVLLSARHVTVYLQTLGVKVGVARVKVTALLSNAFADGDV